MKKSHAVTIAGTILLGALLFGAQQAAAAPPFPVGPTDVVAPTVPPDPDPCETKRFPCDLTIPTLVTDVPTDDPTPTDEPTEPADPTESSQPSDTPVTTTKQQPVDQPAQAPSGVPTPNRIDTGAGPAETGPVSWWLIAVPTLALLALAAAGTFLVIQRSERRPS